MMITVRNKWLLRAFGFEPVHDNPLASMPAGLWLRVAGVRLRKAIPMMIALFIVLTAFYVLAFHFKPGVTCPVWPPGGVERRVGC